MSLEFGREVWSPGDDGCTEQIILGNGEGYTPELESEKGTNIARHPSSELACRQLIDFQREMDANLHENCHTGGLRPIQEDVMVTGTLKA